MQTKMYVIQPQVIKVDQAKVKKQRVAVYCRVSKNTAEQIHSLEIQESYFERIVEENRIGCFTKFIKTLDQEHGKMEETAILK
ncbi:hypothetical protein [Gemmiger sp.]|uniref:hypothetical protein n=1 Tax=Gemmiger sp. TaxID=2049027 RepID=UPI0025C68D2A|nr:hypothetical protein [Gemmiger sp.]